MTEYKLRESAAQGEILRLRNKVRIRHHEQEDFIVHWQIGPFLQMNTTGKRTGIEFYCGNSWSSVVLDEDRI